jgi:hypothetical protein
MSSFNHLLHKNICGTYKNYLHRDRDGARAKFYVTIALTYTLCCFLIITTGDDHGRIIWLSNISLTCSLIIAVSVADF